MLEDVAEANIGRSYSLAATSIAIFTFTLFFLFPRFRGGEVDPLLFQTILLVMGVATFSFVFSSLYYYSASLGRAPDATRRLYAQRGDRLWLLGYTLLLLAPTLILFAIHLPVVGGAWLALWLLYLLFVIRHFPRVQTLPPAASGNRPE